MGSVFALLSAVPGKEREILERIAKLPGLVQQQHLFGEQIAIRLDESQLALAQQFATWQGVREARIYHDHDAWVVKARGVGPNT